MPVLIKLIYYNQHCEKNQNRIFCFKNFSTFFSDNLFSASQLADDVAGSPALIGNISSEKENLAPDLVDNAGNENFDGDNGNFDGENRSVNRLNFVPRLGENRVAGESSNPAPEASENEDGGEDFFVPRLGEDRVAGEDLNSAQDARNEEEDEAAANIAGESEDGINSSIEGKWLTYAELMMDSYPSKSKIIYLKAYKSFERFLRSKGQFVANSAPTEIQILNYFHFLKHEKNLAPTTLWSTYSRVNACVKRLYGFSLKDFVRVSDVLKSYESGYKVKKASIFTPQEV
jgi:hypothetical protein